MPTSSEQPAFSIAAELRRGLAYHRSGELEKAEMVYGKILEIDPQQPDALHLLGLAALAAGNLDKAERMITGAIEADHLQPVFFNNLGNALFQKKDFSQAASKFKQAIQLNPSYAEAHYNLGNALQMLGQLAEAIASYRQAVAIDAGLWAAWLNMGRSYRQTKDNDRARHCFHQVLNIKPDSADAYDELGHIAYGSSQTQAAIEHYEKALKLKAESWETWFKLGNVYRESGAGSQARECYQKALALKPDCAEINLNLGLSLKSAGDHSGAKQCYLRCLAISPQMAAAHYNLANLYQETGCIKQAIRHYRKALVIDPAAIASLINLGNIYLAQNRLEEAANCFAKALQAQPDNPVALINQGNLCARLNRVEDALALFQKALEIDPEALPAYIGIDNALKKLDRIDDAASIYRQFLQTHPDCAGASFHLGLILQSQGKYLESKQAFQAASEVNPKLVMAQWHARLALPVLYRSQAEIAACRADYLAGLNAISEQIDNPALASSRALLEALGNFANFYLPYQGGNDKALQQQYGDIVCRILAANLPRWTGRPAACDRKPGRKIRIGIISAYLKAHTVGRLFEGWVKNCDRAQFEMFCYLLSGHPDDVSRRYESAADHFYPLWGDIESMARRIRSHDLQVLIYPDIGMYAPATALAGLRLAPVQCAAWGHPVTTGLPTLDYFLSSDLMEPAGAAEHYSERLIRLPNLSIFYKRPGLPPRPKPPAALGISPGDFIYLSPQSLFKYLPQYDDIFARIACQVSRAKFVFIANPSRQATELFKTRLAKAFAMAGLDMAKFCLFLPRLSREDYFSLNLAGNVLLDTFCWSGGKTTLEGISCGLPVVSCPGEFMRGRHSYAMLKLMDVTETIARSPDEYVAIAVKLARDSQFYGRVKQKIKENSHRIFEDLAPVRALEDFFKQAIEPDRR